MSIDIRIGRGQAAHDVSVVATRDNGNDQPPTVVQIMSIAKRLDADGNPVESDDDFAKRLSATVVELLDEKESAAKEPPAQPAAWKTLGDAVQKQANAKEKKTPAKGGAK